MLRLHVKSIFLSGIGMLCVLVGQASAEWVEYSAGHGDIGLAYHDGELELHYHFGNNTIDEQLRNEEFHPSDDRVYVRIGDSANLNAPFAVNFLGLNAGDPLWLLPAEPTTGLPFLGFAAEELPPATFSSASLALTGFSGPTGAQFALWQSGTFGDTVFMQTLGGIDSSDSLPLSIGSHSHYNLGFTQEGVYDITLTGMANFVGGGSVMDTETFRFVVGSATAVPEPGGFVALASLVATGAVVLRRRRQQSKAAAAVA